MRLMSFRQMFKYIALLADQTYTSRAEGQARLWCISPLATQVNNTSTVL